VPARPAHEVRYLDVGDYLHLAAAALDVLPGSLFDVADPDRPGYRNGRQFVAIDTAAAVDMMIRIAGSKAEPDEIDDWIARRLR
jgi:hypothetical protein